MSNFIVTSGQSFTDIDAYACAIAYAELLSLEGKTAEVVLPGILNHSITPTIRAWNLSFKTKPSFKEYKSVIVDVSELVHVAKCAPLDSIVEVYDHRYGFEDFWKEKLSKDAHIDAVGACTTQIWEEFKKRGYSDKISPKSANLLLIGAISNTLDFGAQVTDKRDVTAAKELEKFIDLPKNWKETYFQEQNETVMKDPVQAIQNDTKVLSIPNLGFPLVMGQLELWDSSAFIKEHTEDIRKALKSFKVADWFMSLPSIKEKRNYIYTESKKAKEVLAKVIGAKFEGDIGITDKLWLRKEVRKNLLICYN